MARMDPLREHLVQLLSGKGAHLEFDKALALVPPDLLGARPAGAPHSAWQLLEHIRIAQWDILEFCRNPGHQSPPWPDGYWPKSADPPNAGAWENCAADCRNDLAAMQELVSDSTQDLYARLPQGDGQTLLKEALVLADHNSYHLGQLVFLAKLLESGK